MALDFNLKMLPTNTDTNIDTNIYTNIDTNTETNIETNTDTNTNIDTNTDKQVKLQKQRGGEGPRWNLIQQICRHLIFREICHTFSSNDIRQKSVDQQDLLSGGGWVGPPIFRTFLEGSLSKASILVLGYFVT